jgi:hypothetical protein
MSIVTRTIVLTGCRSGLTVKLGMYQFNDGKIDLRGSASDIESLSHWMAINYQAYPVGSCELKEASDGQCDLPAPAEQDAEHAVLDGVQPRGEGTPAAEASDVGPADGAVEGPADGPVPEGDGHEHAGIQRLQEALDKLDVMDDTHWRTDGLPAVAAVEGFLGSKTTRTAIEAVAPDLKRKG